MASVLNIASTTKTFRVAVVGVGLVGGEFITQLLAFPSPSPFRLVSLSSSKSTAYHPDGLTVSTSSWKDELVSTGRKPNLQFLLRELAALVKPGQEVVLVDNTSSNDVAAFYPQFLKYGVNIITPNKKAFSSDLTLYEQILSAGVESGARFFNEATVGLATGDKVLKIEGVFSGTMSYIFNEFSTGKEGVLVSLRSWASRGRKEPHPADDLNGADVARKLTILSRFIPSLRSALPAGYQSVSTKSLVPPELDGIESGDEFIKRLPEFDAQFEKLRSDASKEGKVLRYAGVIDVLSGVIKADLEKYPITHPFATALGGSDNIIMFHTERYGARPLVVQGAGAGAAVTAMGVMSDLLKLV
ncbi:aspartate kinase homoserine dehydrogenase [Daedaleopsis nitida]|nr:aspartate kinase homoserine dehydrogenase [Daedaleopsis nitida]